MAFRTKPGAVASRWCPPGHRWQVDSWRSRYWTVFELTRLAPHSPPPSGIFPGGEEGQPEVKINAENPGDFSWEFGSQF